MKKLISFISLALLMSILMIGCVSFTSPKEPPKITITIDDKQINYVVAKNQWNGAMYDREDTFKILLEKYPVSQIPYIEIGSTATVTFANRPPRKFTVYDILIDKNGNQLYSHKEIIKIPVELKNGKYSFEIKKHTASKISSYYAKDKTDFRGFRMIANWGENECEYAFIIRTDSH